VMDKWFVAVTAGRWQINGMQAARNLGFKVVAIDSNPEAEGFALADHVINLPLDDVQSILNELNGLRGRLHGVASFASDAGVPLAAVIREYFDLPGALPELSSRLVNKFLQRCIWEEHGVPGPRMELVTSPQAALVAIEKFGFPLIIKPADSSGSRGVTKLESSDDDILEAVDRAFHFAKTNQVLLESFMDGVEFTVESFSVRGKHHILAVTEKLKVEGTRDTVARELATPKRSQSVIDRIIQVVISAYRALGYEDGPGHAEAILMRDGEIGLVEVAGRGGGFLVFDRLVPSVSGIDIARLTVMQAVGMQLEPIFPKQNAVVLRFVPSRAGKLKSINGIELANELEGVEVGAIANIGDVFTGAATDGDRQAWILSSGSTPEIAQKRADQAEGLLRFVLT